MPSLVNRPMTNFRIEKMIWIFTKYSDLLEVDPASVGLRGKHSKLFAIQLYIHTTVIFIPTWSSIGLIMFCGLGYKNHTPSR